MTHPLSAPETKVAGDEGHALSALMSAFEAFKETNDTRLSEIERRAAADPLTLEKLERIDATLDAQKSRLDQLATKARRPALEGTTVPRDAMAEKHAEAFSTYARFGEASGLKALEAKALSAGAEGGYLVPTAAEAEIDRRLTVLSPIRALAQVITIGAGTYKKPFMTSGPAAGWAAETAARPETATPALVELTFPATELYAMPAATQALLDDARVNVEEWLAGEVDAAFAAQEGAAFVVGSGVSRPKGFLSYNKAAESAWTWDKVGYVVTGAAGAFPAAGPTDPLLDLVYTLKTGYRQNATFLMNRSTQAAIRKLKDASGDYLWVPPAAAGASASLLGFPVAESEDMPNIAADAYPVAFGDFRRFYLVVDRAGVRVLRDPYSAKPYVLFYVTKRVGGGIQNFDAAKLLKFGTS